MLLPQELVPRVLLAVRLELTVEPRVDLDEEGLRELPGLGLKLVGVVLLDPLLLFAAADHGLARLPADEDLHVDHVVLLLAALVAAVGVSHIT